MLMENREPDPVKIRNYYSNPKIMERIFEVARQREFVPVFKGKYGKRPDAINMLGDLKLMISNGATSFHMSVERWANPMRLNNDMKQRELEELRSGWDVLLDIDCDKSYVYAKEATSLLIKALRAHGVKNISVKFSGNRGFHIALPFESLPKEVEGKSTIRMYPELLQRIARYLAEFIKERLGELLIEKYPELSNEIIENDGTVNPYRIMTIEENWSVRHLFRAPYSLNEKTWLVSLPVKPENLENFELEHARMESVDPTIGFLDKWEEREAENLVFEAIDWATSKERRKHGDEEFPVKKRRTIEITKRGKVEEIHFPPCIKKGLEGLEDGRKRFLFILINFLKLMKWDNNKIKEVVEMWNKERNKEPLREAYIQAQLKYAFKKQRAYITPNCDNKDYYKDIGICSPDKLCERINNPVSYALRRAERKLKENSRKGKKARNRTSRSRAEPRKN